MGQERNLDAGSGSTPSIQALRRQKQADLCEFKASLVYITSSRIVRATQRDRVSKRRGRG